MANPNGTLHVVMSVAGAGVLREALRIAGRRDRIVSFSDCLTYGPIDPPSPATRLQWFVDTLGYRRQDWAWLPTNVYRFWRHALSPCTRRIVWTCSRSAIEHAAFLSWIERAGPVAYDVIDLADIEVTQNKKDGSTVRGRAVALGFVAPEALAAETLWEHATPLGSGALASHLEHWRGLRSEDAALRVMGSQGLVSAEISAFDTELLCSVSGEWQSVIRIIGQTLIGLTMAKDEISYFQVGGDFLASRLMKLMASGKLESRSGSEERGQYFGLTTLARNADVRLPKIGM